MAHVSQLAPDEGERVLTMGSSRAGKSALTDMNMIHVQATRPMEMQVLLDTKPRYRAEKERGRFRVGRKSAAYRYESWRNGPTLPNSCVVDIWDEKPFKSFFKEPGEIAIMQGAEVSDWKRMLFLLNGFVNAHIKGRGRRVIVDELLDFYQRNTLGIDSRNDVFYRTVRAGGERGIGSDFNLHRPHGAPPLIIAMASRINLFHLRMESDMKYLREAGIKDAMSPEGNYIFRQYKIQPGGTVSKPFTGKLVLPEWYLSQLSDT